MPPSGFDRVRWVPGSEDLWVALSSSSGFCARLATIVGDSSLSVDDMHAAIEAFVVAEALACGVVSVVGSRPVRNPSSLQRR